MVRLIHIAPELPPIVGGVADYTAILSQRLVEVSDGTVEPVLMHAGNQPAEAIDVPFPVEDLSGECSATALAQATERLAAEGDGRAVVLLEYSGYGYASRGVPLWLARGLRRVCGDDGVPLITMFHELYATGPPWTSAFWVSPVQRFVAAQFARTSVGILTTHRENAKWLETYRYSPDVSVDVQPSFSNVGEPDSCPPFDQRTARIVVFGGSGRKSNIYVENRKLLAELLNNRSFEKVLDIGPSDNIAFPDDDRITRRGILSASEISSVLSFAMLGIVSYPGSRLGKSGAIAAFAAHGVPFLLLDEDGRGETDLYDEGTHFWRVEKGMDEDHSFSSETLGSAGRAIRNLYTDKMSSRHAARHLLETVDRGLLRLNREA